MAADLLEFSAFYILSSFHTCVSLVTGREGVWLQISWNFQIFFFILSSFHACVLLVANSNCAGIGVVSNFVD